MLNNMLSRPQPKSTSGTVFLKVVKQHAEEVNVDNDWEELIDIICGLLSTSRANLARGAGLHRDTLNKGTRAPSERVLLALWRAILQLAEEQDKEGSHSYNLLEIFDNQWMQDTFYNLASRSSPRQKEIARVQRQSLIGLRNRIQEIKEYDQRIEQRNIILAERDQVIREKSEELEAFQSDEERREMLLQSLDEQETSKDEIISAQQKEIDRLKKELDLYTRH